MASFIDAYDAVACSIEISKYFETLDRKIIFSLALATGKPVDEHSTDLFKPT